MSHNMANFGPLMAETSSGVWGSPANFNQFRVLALLWHGHRSTEVGKTLQEVWPSPGLVHYIYIFGGSCPLSLCLQVLHSRILAVLLHGTGTAAISQTLWHGTRNRIMERSQRAPPIFGRSAITLGISTHSTFIIILYDNHE